MPNIGLDGSNVEWLSLGAAFAKHIIDGPGFDWIANFGTGPVRLNETDILKVYAGFSVNVTDKLLLRLATWRRKTYR